MKKWEYEIVYTAFTDEDSIEKEKIVMNTLAEYGNKGWELIQMDNLLQDNCIDGYMIFKQVKE